MHRRTLLLSLWTVCTLVMQHTPARAEVPDEARRVSALLHRQFDQPGLPLTVSPVVVVGDAAVAGWSQGERGGRALLWLRHSHWQISLCAGDALLQPEVLEQSGLGSAQARVMAHRLAQAEASLPPSRRAQLSRFEGLLRLEEHAGHPPQPAAQPAHPGH